MSVLIAAAITTAVALAAQTWLILKLAPPENRHVLAIAGLAAVPLHPAAFYALRLPLHGLLTDLLGTGQPLAIVSLLYAPVTEELAKLFVLLIPLVRRYLSPPSAVALSLAIGLGFGIGEIWFLATRLMDVPAFAAQPFWMFGGFLTERFVVCFLHGAMMIFALAWLAERGILWFVLGVLVAMTIHFAINFPIYLMANEVFGWSREAWSQLIMLWIVAVAVTLLIDAVRMTGRRTRAVFLGTAVCPSCGRTYDRPWIALNLGIKRYERCPCGHWHWV